jgi:hypothetical protein
MHDIKVKGGHGRSVQNRTDSAHYNELNFVRKEDIEYVPEIRRLVLYHVTSE